MSTLISWSHQDKHVSIFWLTFCYLSSRPFFFFFGFMKGRMGGWNLVRRIKLLLSSWYFHQNFWITPSLVTFWSFCALPISCLYNLEEFSHATICVAFSQENSYDHCDMFLPMGFDSVVALWILWRRLLFRRIFLSLFRMSWSSRSYMISDMHLC